MKRGDIVTVAARGDYGKPRPAVVIQSNAFIDDHATVLVCPFATTLTEAPLIRIPVEPSQENGLAAPSQIMADKIVTMKRQKIGAAIGQLDNDTLTRLNRTLALFIGIAE